MKKKSTKRGGRRSTTWTKERPGPRAPKEAFGRRKALGLIDSMMGEPANLDKLREALQRKFNRSPVGFYRQIIFPLMPREMLSSSDAEKSDDLSKFADMLVLVDSR